MYSGLHELFAEFSETHLKDEQTLAELCLLRCPRSTPCFSIYACDFQKFVFMVQLVQLDGHEVGSAH